MISVILPTYNRAGTIERAAHSVLDQTYQDLELIVVDDCSTDETEAIVTGIGDVRCRYIRLPENRGACVARNTGIEQAKGELIAFQDSDDYWLPEKLTVQTDILRSMDADVCFCALRRHYETTDKTTVFPGRIESGMLSHEALSTRPLISTQTILAKKAVFDENRFDPLVKKTQDYDWSIRASRNHRFYYLNEVLVEQYFQEDSISNRGIAVVKETREYLLKKYPEECAANPRFELTQLKSIARAKTLLGEDASAELMRIARLDKSVRNVAKCILLKSKTVRQMYKKKYLRENLINRN